MSKRSNNGKHPSPTPGQDVSVDPTGHAPEAARTVAAWIKALSSQFLEDRERMEAHGASPEPELPGETSGAGTPTASRGKPRR